MDHRKAFSRRIAILREKVAGKIAAGEVIDRPFSVVRELLDNAIDAGSRNIEVYIEDGGLTRIRIIDDGHGMGREDLAICCKRHATSKIRKEEDLYRLTTLGFRGEALAAVGACARLEIITMEPGADSGHRLYVEGGKELSLENWQAKQGTLVSVADLFFNMPARKKFLKSRAGESAMCSRGFVEKALAHPEISFKHFLNGKLKYFFPAADLKTRIGAACALEAEHLQLLDSAGEGFEITAIAARPEVFRADKRYIQIFVNRRRIYEYSLVQAVEYGFKEYLPGGRFPVVFLFLKINPELVDFNIHPAKREVRFRNLSLIRHGVIAMVKAFLINYDLRAHRVPDKVLDGVPDRESPVQEGDLQGEIFTGGTRSGGMQNGVELSAQPERYVYARGGQREIFPLKHREEQEEKGPCRYCGQVFDLFLLVEWGERLFIIDQHAAHERLLYEELRNKKSNTQELLFPIHFEAGPAEAVLVRERISLWREIGIQISTVEKNAFEINSLPEDFLALDESELVKALLSEYTSFEELKDRIYSMAACRLAVKDGETLDQPAAEQLAADVFNLTNGRCPHGRPIWYEIRREELFRRVGRII
jgi:DNA mismatch repair protein MutL